MMKKTNPNDKLLERDLQRIRSTEDEAVKNRYTRIYFARKGDTSSGEFIFNEITKYQKGLLAGLGSGTKVAELRYVQPEYLEYIFECIDRIKHGERDARKAFNLRPVSRGRKPAEFFTRANYLMIMDMKQEYGGKKGSFDGAAEIVAKRHKVHSSTVRNKYSLYLGAIRDKIFSEDEFQRFCNSEEIHSK